MTISELHRRYLEAKSVSIDTRSMAKNDIFFALKGENFDANAFVDEALNKGAKYVVFDDKTRYKEDKRYILVDDALETLQQLAHFHRNFLQIPVLAITGSNGKTTTKELVYSVLSQKYYLKATRGNLNNHIGVPLTLLSMNRNTEIGVVEMGTNHFGEIKQLCEIAEPDYGYITNFGKAHLESFKTINGVIKAKTELYDFLYNHQKTAFVNLWDDKQKSLTEHFRTVGVKPLELHLSETPFVSFVFNGEVVDTHLTGYYNLNNIAAAIAIGQYFGVADQDIIEAISSYKPQNKRSQFIEKQQVNIILDAYNANPTSMKVALETFAAQRKEQKIPVLGDMFELGSQALEEHQAIVDMVETLGFESAIFIGELFSRTKHGNAYKTFKDFESFKNNCDLTQFYDRTLLIKASRGMALERIVDLFE